MGYNNKSKDKAFYYFDRLFSAFRAARVIELKRIANELIKDAVLENNKILAELSVVAYAIMKISSKDHIVSSRNWKFAKNRIEQSFKAARKYIADNNLEGLEKELIKIQDNVSKIDSNLGHFVNNTIYKARLKMASSAYALGLSLSASAELTGADKKELMLYLGSTKIHDEERTEIRVSDRIKKFTEKLSSS